MRSPDMPMPDTLTPEVSRTNEEKLESELVMALRRNESVLVHQHVTDGTETFVKNILRGQSQTNLVDYYEKHNYQEVDAADLKAMERDELWDLSRKNVVITNVDLWDKELDAKLGPFRAEKARTQVEYKPLSQILIIKPGTNEHVPGWHCCFNWTINI